MELLFFPILILVMYFMLLRPQQRRMKAQRELISSLDIGDDIVTESGLYGTISDIDGDTAFLLVADGVEVKVTKSSIAGRVSYSDASDEAE